MNETVQPEPVPSPAPGADGHPRVVLIGGASGSGKSFLARRYGRPHLPLDAFYREQAEDQAPDGPGPRFPRTPYGEIDWDHPDTWNGQAAVEAILQLRDTGSTRIPDYDISTSSIVGTLPLHLGQAAAQEDGPQEGPQEGPTAAPAQDAAAGPIVAEGIFAAQMPALLQAAGVPFEAWYIDQSPVTTAVRRFARDVAERRKPLLFLLHRGWALFRSDGARKQAAVDAGFTARPKAAMHKDLSALSGTPAES